MRFSAACVCEVMALASVAFSQQHLFPQRVALYTQDVVSISSPPGDKRRLFLVEQGWQTGTGQIRVLDLATGVLQDTPYLSVGPVAGGVEQGLLGLAFHPNFMTNGYFYVYYTEPPEPGVSAGTCVLARYRAAGGDPTSLEAQFDSGYTLLRIPQPDAVHNGGWLGFGPDGYLYIGVGDGGGYYDSDVPGTVVPPGHTPGIGNAQDLHSLMGKILRIDVDGADNIPGNDDDDAFVDEPARNYSIPPDNPFVNTEYAPEVFLYGLRNPWRCSFDSLTGDLWIGDVGQTDREEIDFNPPRFSGRNFGWRCREGTLCTNEEGCACDAGSYIPPVWEYEHTGFRCAVIGGFVYRGCAIAWMYGRYFFADYCGRQFDSFARLVTGQIYDFRSHHDEMDPPGPEDIYTVATIGADDMGELYFSDRNGNIYRVVDAAGILDCNGNGRDDRCDIAAATSADDDGNGIPDECDIPACSADFDLSGGVDGQDVESFFTAWEAGGYRADVNFDGGIDGFDVETFFRAWEAGGC